MANDSRTADPLSHLGWPITDSIHRPPLEHKSSDNLLDYYQSEDAGRTYYQSMPGSTSTSRPAIPSHSVSSSSSSYSQSPDIPEQVVSRRPPNGLDLRRKNSHHIAAQPEVYPTKRSNMHDDSGPDLISRRGLDGSRLEPIILPGVSGKTADSVSSAPVSALPGGPERSESSGHQRSHSEIHVMDLKDYKSRSTTSKTHSVTEFVSGGRPVNGSQTIEQGDNSSYLSVHDSLNTEELADDNRSSTLQPVRRDTKPTVIDNPHVHSNRLQHTKLPSVEHPYAHVVQVSDPQYLAYVAGVHATAGPLPSPPRNIIPPISSPPPKRPPRLQSPPPNRRHPDPLAMQLLDSSNHESRQSSKSNSPVPSLQRREEHGQQPFPVKKSASVAPLRDNPVSPTTPRNRDREPSAFQTETVHKKHIREGAQSNDIEPSAANLARGAETIDDLVAAVGQAIGDFGVESESEHSLVARSESQASQSDRSRMRRATSWISERSDFSSAYANSGLGSSKLVELTPGHVDGNRVDATPARHSQDFHREALRGSKEFRRSSSVLSSPPSVPHRFAHNASSSSHNIRTVSAWPQAMQYTDVLSLRTPLERTAAYARKLSELAERDCGLSEWLQLQKNRSRPSQRGTGNAVTPQSSSARAGSAMQPRVVSHGSVASEATFPLRADAYVAINLMQKDGGEGGHQMPLTPNVPYPSLARLPSQNHPYGGASVSTPITPKSAGGFFASIGRKASVKKDRIQNPPSLPANKFLISRSPTSPAQLRSMKLGPASIPGGPRSPPGGAARSPSILGQSRNALAPIPQEDLQPNPLPSRSPSLPITSRVQQPPRSDPAFAHQVDKLADILPHVDRQVLAGYLRRAGQDMVAIGQYLEDEKNGTVRADV